MAELNLELMDIFPRSTELPPAVKRDEVLVLIRRVLEASRAGIDEITERSQKVLTEEELIRLHALGESISGFAIEATECDGPSA